VAAQAAMTDADVQNRLPAWINEGAREFVRATKCYCAPLPPAALTVGVDAYDIPTLWGRSDILAFRELYVTTGNGDRVPMVEVSPVQMGQLQAAWDASPAVSGGVEHAWTMYGLNLLVLDPVAVAGEMVGGIFAMRPPTMVSVSDVPVGIPEEYQLSGPGNFASAKAMLDDNRFEEAQFFQAAFDRAVAECVRDIGRPSGGMQPPLMPSRGVSRAMVTVWDRMRWQG
jgi:hypothetical protein